MMSGQPYRHFSEETKNSPLLKRNMLVSIQAKNEFVCFSYTLRLFLMFVLSPRASKVYSMLCTQKHR